MLRNNIPEKEDWRRIYYCVISEGNSCTPRLLGVGNSLHDAKQDALEHLASFDDSTAMRYAKAISKCQVDSGYMVTGENTIFGRLCEAKVNIYGHRYGYDNLVLQYDPNSNRYLVKFIKVRRATYEKETGLARAFGRPIGYTDRR